MIIRDNNNAPLRRLLVSWFPGRSLQHIIQELCGSAWRQSGRRRDAFIDRVAATPYPERHQLEHRHWRALADLRAMFRRLLGDDAPDAGRPPAPRRPMPEGRDTSAATAKPKASHRNSDQLRWSNLGKDAPRWNARCSRKLASRFAAPSTTLQGPSRQLSRRLRGSRTSCSNPA